MKYTNIHLFNAFKYCVDVVKILAVGTFNAYELNLNII